jgi:sugar phosphate isomerase/epimerase
MVSYHPSLVAKQSLNLRDCVRIAGISGFELVDLNLREVADADTTVLREQLDAAGIQPGAASLPVELRAGDGAFEEGLDFLHRVAPLAAGIGVQVMHRSIPAANDHPFSELQPLLQRRWSECAGILREHGILVAVEPLGTPYRRKEGTHEFISRLDMAADFATPAGRVSVCSSIRGTGISLARPLRTSSM